MIRNTDSKSTSNRKQAFRLALLLAVAGSSSLAPTESGLFAQTPQVASCELPVYPFAPSAPAVAEAGAKKAMIRILGFRGSKAAAQVTSNSVLPIDSHTASGMIALPSLPSMIESSVASSPLTHLPPALADSPVVAATATRPVQGVQASLSDAVQAESHDAVDLVNSLDDMMSPPKGAANELPIANSDFTDSINVEVSSEADDADDESGISMNMSDKDAGPSTASVQSKTPELLNTKRNKSLRAELGSQVSDGLSKVEPTSPQPIKPQLNAIPESGSMPLAMPLPVPFANTSEAVEPLTVEMQPVASSRKDQRPGAMNIRVEGEPSLTASPSRPPLVPMLASTTSRGKMAEQVSGPNPRQQAMPKPMSMPMPLNTGTSTTSPSKEVSVNVKDSVAMQSVEAIQGLSVENEGVCQVIQTGSKSFSLIGLRPGETRVAVITETEGKRNVQIQQVRVGAAQSSGQDSDAIANDISQTIQQLYPRSKVRITTRGNELVVGGKVESEETAKKILSFVRKATLTPVVDELQTR